MKIYEALNGLTYQGNTVPVCHPPYEGSSHTYITYQLLGQIGMIYAEGGEAETGVSYAVNVFNDTFDAELIKAVKTALNLGGYIVVIETETYDENHRYNQVVMTATKEGAIYG